MLQVSTDEDHVMRENYSLYYTLMRDVDGYKNKNIMEILSFLETLYSKNTWWYGFLSEDEALNLINNMDISQGAAIIVYSPITGDRGQVHVYVKLAKLPMGKKFPVVEIIKITEGNPISSRQFPLIVRTIEELKNKIKSDYKVNVSDGKDHKSHPGYLIDNSVEGVVSHYVATVNLKNMKSGGYSSKDDG